jgi:hypothetical protein
LGVPVKTYDEGDDDNDDHDDDGDVVDDDSVEYDDDNESNGFGGVICDAGSK